MEEIALPNYGKYSRMTRERALLQLVIEQKGQLEYTEEVYKEIKEKAVLKEQLLALSQQHLSKNNQLLVHTFLAK
ncbi:MAG: hypothetical protein LBG52_06835 [Candidatus Peribacteria bacterium]|jgi:hypothetical protein|nr:hypothetical protein [Candidatus Peribacteria bacterium]